MSTPLTLGPITNATMEKLQTGVDWTVIESATATSLAAIVAANVTQGGVQHFLTHVTLSYSAAPAVSVLQIKDGTTVIYQVDVSASAPFIVDLNFEVRPLRATNGAALTVGVGSAGGSVVQTLSMTGFSSRSLTSFA